MYPFLYSPVVVLDVSIRVRRQAASRMRRGSYPPASAVYGGGMDPSIRPMRIISSTVLTCFLQLVAECCDLRLLGGDQILLLFHDSVHVVDQARVRPVP